MQQAAIGLADCKLVYMLLCNLFNLGRRTQALLLNTLFI